VTLGDKLHADTFSYVKICTRTRRCKSKICVKACLFTGNTYHSPFASAKTVGNFHSNMSSYCKSCRRTRPRKSKMVQSRRSQNKKVSNTLHRQVALLWSSS